MILQNRVAFVTAAGAGIGRAGALAMAAEGATVIVTDLNAVTAQETAAIIAANGGRGEAAGLDVTDDAAVVRALKSAAQRLVASIFCILTPVFRYPVGWTKSPSIRWMRPGG